jgi:hypothetical protein
MANKAIQKVNRKKPGRSLKEKRAAKRAKNARKSTPFILGDGTLRAAGLLR